MSKIPLIYDKQRRIICNRKNGCGLDLRHCDCPPPTEYTFDGNGAEKWSYTPDYKCSVPYKAAFIPRQRAMDMIARAVLRNRRVVASTGRVIERDHEFLGGLQPSCIEIDIEDPIQPQDSILVYFSAGRQSDLGGRIQGVKLCTRNGNGNDVYFLYENYGTMEIAIEQALDAYDRSRPQKMDSVSLDK